MNKTGVVLGILLFMLMGFFSKAFAHRVFVFAYREDNQIIGNSYFSGGTPCMNCQITVYDTHGKKLAETKTDKKGDFKVKVNYTGTVIVKVNGGEGHLAEFKVQGLSQEEAIGESKSSEAKTTEASTSVAKSNEALKGVSVQEIKQVVREVVREETAPIKAMLLQLEEEMASAKVHDVLGGIGYIFGVWGLFALIRRRKGQ